jgi:hypothetical protein
LKLPEVLMIHNYKKKKKKTYLDKFVSTFDKLKIPQPIKKQSLPSTNTNTYNLTKILNKKKKSKPVTNTML